MVRDRCLLEMKKLTLERTPLDFVLRNLYEPANKDIYQYEVEFRQQVLDVLIHGHDFPRVQSRPVFGWDSRALHARRLRPHLLDGKHRAIGVSSNTLTHI